MPLLILAQFLLIWVLGRVQTPLPILPTPTNIQSFRLNDHVLRAILAIPAAGLDLDMWNAVLEEEESAQDERVSA